MTSISNADFKFQDNNGNDGTVISLKPGDITLLNRALQDIENLKARKFKDVNRFVGEILYSLLPINDSCVHLLDGSILQGNGIYQEFVTYIQSLYTANSSASYFCTESDWQASVSTYGVCGKFVYDSTNNTVRLPKVTGHIEGTIDPNSLGTLVEAGLPNITAYLGTNRVGDITLSGTTPSIEWNVGQNGGALRNRYIIDNYAIQANPNTSYSTVSGVEFNASRSNPIYGNSTTVQTQSIKGFAYIIIANTTKTSIRCDIDNVATDLNAKADKDFDNLTNTAKVMMAKAGMSSERFIELTLTVPTIYTAAADGHFLFIKTATVSTQGIYSYVNHNGVRVLERYGVAGNSGYVRLDMPCQKGDQVYIDTDAGGGSVNVCRFFYAEGSKNE